MTPSESARGKADQAAPTTGGRSARISKFQASKAALIAGAVGFGLVVWSLRRPDQFLHPYVWVEEYKLLNTYQTEGFLHSVTMPVGGYFLWPTSFSVSIAAALSFLHFPRIEYELSTAWFIATLCLLLVPSSRLRLQWRIGMAALLVLAPMNPEVFGVAVYIFWWVTLWPLITLLWSEDYWWLRVPVLILGGMGSIGGSALVLPYAVLFVMTRQRRYAAGTAILGVTSVIQAIRYLTSARVQQIPTDKGNIALQELHNFSYYAFGWLNPADQQFLGFAGACIFLAVFGLVVYEVVRPHKPFTEEMVALGLGLLVLGVLSSVPGPLISLPDSAGPRYYFLPYAVLGWVLLMIVVTSEFRWARAGAMVLIAMSLLSLTQNFSRHDEFVSWSAQLARCQTEAAPFDVPVQFDGLIADMWHQNLYIQPQTCQRLGYR